MVKTLGWAAKDLQLEVFFARLKRDDGTPVPNFQARSLIDLQAHELIKNVPIGQLNWVQTSLPSPYAHVPGWEVVCILTRCRSVEDHELSRRVLGRDTYPPRQHGGFRDAVRRSI